MFTGQGWARVATGPQPGRAQNGSVAPTRRRGVCARASQNPLIRCSATAQGNCRGHRRAVQVPLRHEPVACSSTAVVSVLVSIHRRPAPFTGGHPDRVRAGHGRWRTPVNAGQHCWKACWGRPLRSSNLLSSATSDQAIHHPGHAFGLAFVRLVVSFAVSLILTHIGIKRPKGRRPLLSAIAVWPPIGRFSSERPARRRGHHDG